jgi:hypothetical protein
VIEVRVGARQAHQGTRDFQVGQELRVTVLRGDKIVELSMTFTGF